jgi:transcriptional regulator with XRE-family HTH domain
MTRRRLRGRVTGYLFKLIRESIPRSQQDLAVDVGVDRATIQGWESGRRPLTSVPVGHLIGLRHSLARLGASAALLSALDDAAEADFVLSAITDADPRSADLASHPLGGVVMTHGLTAMLAWAVGGQPPDVVARHAWAGRRRGPVPAGPGLEFSEREAFFANLKVIMDRTALRTAHVLLHRQACFLAGFDQTGRAATWLAGAGRSVRRFTWRHGWSPTWPDAVGRVVRKARRSRAAPRLHRTCPPGPDM